MIRTPYPSAPLGSGSHSARQTLQSRCSLHPQTVTSISSGISIPSNSICGGWLSRIESCQDAAPMLNRRYLWSSRRSRTRRLVLEVLEDGDDALVPCALVKVE